METTVKIGIRPVIDGRRGGIRADWVDMSEILRRIDLGIYDHGECEKALAWIYGHVGADFITMASMMRIPVSMHDVPEDKIYRSHSWTAFGTMDKEGAEASASFLCV